MHSALSEGLPRKLAVGSNRDAGELLYVSTEYASDFQFTARLLELTRRAQPTGVELPIVRESAFSTDSITLLAIPSGDEIRSTLRIYDPLATQTTRVLVEFMSPSGEVLGSVTKTLVAVEGQPPDFPIFPGFAVIHDLTSAMPALQEYEHFHIRVSAVIPGTPFWAMASTTDNESQHVTLITAQ